MAGKGLHQYTVQEAQNATMGQAGSVFLDSTGTTFTPTSGVIVAITMVDETDFNILLAEDNTKSLGVGGAGWPSNDDAGNEVVAADIFPSGMTIYGRWTSVSINSTGACICYIG